MDTQQTNHPEKPIGVFRRSVTFAKKSISLLVQDYRVMYIPLLFGIITSLFMAGFLLFYIFSNINNGKISSGTILFVWFMVVFFSTSARIAVTLSLRPRLLGSSISLKESFIKMMKKTDFIFGWSFVSSAVGMLLVAFPFDSYSLFTSMILSVYWMFGTYFIIPSIVEEEISLASAFSNSVEALKRSWKEIIVVNFAFRLIVVPVFLLFVYLIAVLFYSLPAAPLALEILIFIITVVILLLMVTLMVFSMLFRTSLDLVLYTLNRKEEGGHIAEIILKKPRKTKLL